jgi:hypothetical protein
MKDRTDILVEILRRGRLALTIEGSTFLHALLTGDRMTVAGTGLQLAFPTEIPRYHLTVFLDGGELVFLVADQEEAEGPRRQRHPWSLHVPLAEALETLERSGTGPRESIRDRLATTCRLFSLDDAARAWVLVGLFEAGLPSDNAPFSKRRGTRVAAEAAIPQVRFVTGREFFAGDHDLGLILEPDAAGHPVVRWFVPRVHNGINAIVADVEAMTTELVTFSSWMMNKIRPVVRADFALPEIPEAPLLLGDAMKNLHRFISGLRGHVGLAFPWDPNFSGTSD